MKNLIALSFIFLNITLFSQNATLTGKIENPKNKKVKLLLLSQNGETKNFSSELDKDNNFNIEIQLSQASTAFFSCGEQKEMYIFPGDKIHINVNANKFDESIKFSGKGSIINNYIAEHYLKFADDSTAEFNSNDYKQEPNDYISGLTNKIKLENKHLEKYFKNKKTDKSIINKISSKLYYKNAISAIMYLFTKQRKGKLKAADKNPEYQEIYKYLDELNLNNEQAISNYNYSYFLYIYINFYLFNRNQYTKKVNIDSLDRHMQRFKLAKSVYKDKVLEEFCYFHLKSSLRINSVSSLEKAFNYYMSFSKNDDHKKEIKEKYNALLESINNPKVPEGSIVYKSEEDIENLSLKKVLEKYKGKVIYLDFWASWCGPCIQMMKESKKLHKTLKGKEVEFVYCSTDRNKKAWLSAISAYDIHGTHYKFNNEKDSDYIKNYNIQGIPRYMLINKKGEIVDGNAKRPNNPELIDDIDKLLD